MSTMSIRALFEAFRTSKPSGHNSLLSRDSQWISTSSWTRPFKAQSYSTDRAGSTIKGEVVPKKKKYEDDPERRAKYLKYHRDYWAHKCAADPEFLSRERERSRDRRLSPNTQLYHRHHSKTWRRLQRSNNPAYVFGTKLTTWIRRYAWFREDLNWTPWQPIYYPDPVEHRCHECNSARHRGSRLWWHMDPHRFMCHSCYVKLPEGGLPKGYEDCTTIKEVAARKETLETRLSPSSTTSTSTCQSWRPFEKSPAGSRPFSTFRAVWTKSKNQKLGEEGLD